MPRRASAAVRPHGPTRIAGVSVAAAQAARGGVLVIGSTQTPRTSVRA